MRVTITVEDESLPNIECYSPEWHRVHNARIKAMIDALNAGASPSESADIYAKYPFPEELAAQATLPSAAR